MRGVFVFSRHLEPMSRLVMFVRVGVFEHPLDTIFNRIELAVKKAGIFENFVEVRSSSDFDISITRESLER